MAVTTGEVIKSNQGDPQATGHPPVSEGGTPKTRTITETELQQLIKTAVGREREALVKQFSEVTKEAETLKKQSSTLTMQLAEKDNVIEEVQGKIENLEEELNDLSASNPDYKALREKKNKELAALHAWEKKIKVERDQEKAEIEALKAEKESPAYKEYQEFQRMSLMGKIAGEFKNADMDRLRALCDKAKVPDNEDEVRGIAEALWGKAEGAADEEGEKKEPPHADSGDNKGGSDDDDNLSPREKIEKGLEQSRNKRR